MKFKGHLNILLIIFSLFVLYLISRYNYLLFHSLVEIFSIVVAFGIFIIAWNSRALLDNHYLLFIGVAYLFVGGIDLIHTLAYKGMGVFKGQETNLATQLWIGARYLESLSLLIAPFFIKRKVRTGLEFLGYMIIISLLFISIFYWKFFPICFIEGTGLTAFKKISEYIISLILLGSLIILSQKRGAFDTSVFRLLALSILFTIASELSFTFYIHAYGFSNLIGHLFKVISFYLIYKALVETGLTKPYNLLFRNLKKSEEELRKARKELEIRVQERTAELAKVNRALRTLSECNQVIVRAKEESKLLQEMCRTIVEVGGYHLAWIGFVEKDKGKAIQPVAKAGFKEEYGNLTWVDNKEDNDPIGLAIQTRRSTIAKNILNEPAFTNLRTEAIKWGYTSSVALPLITDGQSIGVLSIYSKGPDAFDLEEMKLLEELSNDLTYGILALRAQTERKRAEETLRENEEKYRLVVDNANEAICVAQDGKLRFFNPKTVELMGFSVKEVTSMPFIDFVHPEDRDMVWDRYQKRITGKAAPRFYSFRLVDGRGNIRWVEINSVLISWKDRPATLTFLTDITERKQAEQEKAVLEEQFRQSQKMEAIGRLAGGVAHDFNNLLTVIKGYSQLSLTEMEEGDPFKGNIEEIKKAADRAADLTRQLLAFSRRQIMEMKVLDLNDLLRNLDKMLHRVIGEDIKLLFQLTEDLGRVKTDPGQIEQVVMNLVVNARDAMPSGGKLTIETANVVLDEEYAGSHVAVKPGPYVMLSVSDTGCGMAPEARERIFEPFFTTKEKGKGTGLGLSTVYGIVKQSGGNIWVYSEPGKGTTFKIYLPRVDEPLEGLKGEVKKEELPQGSETILIVEDDEDVRKLAARVLEKQGYTVLVASQGSDALSLCGEYKKPIHLVLCDVVMPGMGGRELTDRLTSFHPEMKLLYMSGYTENAVVHHGILIEGMNYIQKPFTVEGLVRKVREALD
jgi:two-component system cell cycle sensor histidine kinase/response regulator CckA